jgi:hypothetical protein
MILSKRNDREQNKKKDDVPHEKTSCIAKKVNKEIGIRD